MATGAGLFGGPGQVTNIAQVTNQLGVNFWEQKRVAALVNSLKTTYSGAVPRELLSQLPDLQPLREKVERLGTALKEATGDDTIKAGQDFAKAQHVANAVHVIIAKALGKFFERAQASAPITYAELALAKGFQFKAETYMRLFTAMSSAEE